MMLIIVNDPQSKLDYVVNLIFDNPWRTAFFLLIIFVYIVIKYGSNLEKLIAWIAKFFSWTGISAKRFATTHDLQSRFSLATEKLRKEHLDIPEEKLKIKWVKSLDKESFKRSEKAIIRLNYDTDVNDNFVRLSIGYIKGSVVPHARDYMDKALSESIDYYYTKKIICFEERPDTLDHFIARYLRNRIEENEKLIDYFNYIEEIDESGNLSRIFLKEVKRIPQKYYPKKLFDTTLISEIDNLLH